MTDEELEQLAHEVYVTSLPSNTPAEYVALAEGVTALLAEVRRLRGVACEAVREALGWAWVPCDQTIACPCCGVAWWTTDGDVDDDWHAPGCALQALLARVGLSTGRRVSQGAMAYDHAGDAIDAARVEAGVRRLRAVADLARALRTTLRAAGAASDRDAWEEHEALRARHTDLSARLDAALAALDGGA